MRKYSIGVHRVHHSVRLVMTLFVLLGLSVQNVAGSVYMSLLMQPYTTVTSPPIIIDNGTAGVSTIYTNNTSAKVSVPDVEDYVDNNTGDVDASADKGTHGNFTAQQYGPDLFNDTLTEEDTSGVVIEDLKTGSSRKSTSLTISSLTVSGTDRALYVFISAKTKGTGAGVNEPDSVVWDSAGVNEALTQVGFINTNKMATMIYNLTNPTARTADVTISDASSNWNWDGAVAGAYAFSGVDQTNPHDTYASNSGTGTASQVTVSSASGDMVFDVTAVDQQSPTVDGSQTQQWNLLQTKVYGASSNETGAGSVSMDWRWSTSALWSSSGISINPASVASNYELDLEVQWTSADFDESNEELCIYGGTMGAENITVYVWNGSGWENLFTDLNSGWNNVSVSSYLNSSTFTIRFKGGTETSDTTQDTWNIDATLLHIWTGAGAGSVDFNYVLKMTENNGSSWKVRLNAYDQSNIARLNNCSIYIYDGSNSTQIVILNGAFNQQTGPWYDLTASDIEYIWMHAETSSVGTSYVYAYLEILVPNTTTYARYIIAFEVT